MAFQRLVLLAAFFGAACLTEAFMAPTAKQNALYSAQRSQATASRGRMYMLFGGSEKKKREDEEKAGKPAGKQNVFDQLSKLNEITQKTNAIQKDLAGTMIMGSSMEGKVKVTFTGSQVPVEVEVTEEAMSQGAAKLSAAVTEAMKDAHTKSVNHMQTKLMEFYNELGISEGIMDKLKGK